MARALRLETPMSSNSFIFAYILLLGIGAQAFTDPVTGNCPVDFQFALQASYPAIDAGTYTSSVKSASAFSNSAVLSDPMQFAVGRYLKTQSKAEAIVTNVNLSTGVVTVDRNINWKSGEGVFFKMYYGNAPDIGACEYVGLAGAIPPSSPQNLRLSKFYLEQEILTNNIIRALNLNMEAFNSRLKLCQQDMFDNVLGCLLNVQDFIRQASDQAGTGAKIKELETLEANLKELLEHLQMQI